MAVEISGDGDMTISQRLRYLVVNLMRNFRRSGAELRHCNFFSDRLSRTSAMASPGRVLTEAFLGRELPKLLSPGEIRVLEIGCGSGSLTKLLAEFGYRGSYVGVDVADRFDRSMTNGFRRDFIRIDAHDFKTDGQFDLVISVSALEHIPEDHRLIQQLSGFVAPGGLQLHFLPSPWGLPAYLWHGYRQYTFAALGERFNINRVVGYSLGGIASFLLHFTFITLGEMLLPLRLRQRLPRLYGRLLDSSLRLDRWLPACATMVAVCQPVGAADGV